MRTAQRIAFRSTLVAGACEIAAVGLARDLDISNSPRGCDPALSYSIRLAGMILDRFVPQR